jgi:PPOX class probable F420-dependent enzyme
MQTLDRFSSHQYINLETYRRNGSSIRTPVWFVQDGDRLLVRTIADSGKVKRIHNNAWVSIAPCKMDGTPLGDWQPAMAHDLSDDESARLIDRLLDQKYGLMKKIFGIAAGLQGRKNTVLEIRLQN